MRERGEEEKRREREKEHERREPSSDNAYNCLLILFVVNLWSVSKATVSEINIQYTLHDSLERWQSVLDLHEAGSEIQYP